jgi:molecular chaperone DnaK
MLSTEVLYPFHPVFLDDLIYLIDNAISLTALASLKAAHQAQDVAQVNIALEQMNAAWTAASEEIYKAQQAGAEAGAAPGGDAGQANGGASNDTVEDAQFEEVK